MCKIYKIGCKLCDIKDEILEKSWIGENPNNDSLLLIDVKTVFDLTADLLSYIIDDEENDRK